jgi:hypothetical protein
MPINTNLPYNTVILSLISPCDFYYDLDRDVSNNPVLYDTYSQSQKMDQLRYFVHFQEYAWDNDIPSEAIAIEYWYYYVKDTGISAHKHDWEVFIIFLKQTATSQVLLLKAGQHGSLVESIWSSVIKEGSTHTRLYVDTKHAMFFSKPGGFTDGVKVSYSDSRNKPIYVWDTNAIISTSGDYDKITNWEGYHVYWDYDSQYWWTWKYVHDAGTIYGPWRKVPWKYPEEGTY